MIRLLAALGLVLALLGGASPVQAAGPSPAPREVLALYDSAVLPIAASDIHRNLEMPLNHLGLVVRYHDIKDPLPDPASLSSVLGVVTWFRGGGVPEPDRFLTWGLALMDAGKRFVVLGDLPFQMDKAELPASRPLLLRFLARLGLGGSLNFIQPTHAYKLVLKDRSMVEFEQPLTGRLPPFPQVVPISPRARSFLVARRGDDPASESHLVVVTEQGGFAANGYDLFISLNDNSRSWVINPFAFLEQALGLDGLPRPDVTTLGGRRIYFSHIDGDGWNNVTEIPAYGQRPTLAAEVVLKEAIAPYPDLPVTVGVIAADVDEDWAGLPESGRVLRELLALPQVEPGSHTYTHPFDWGFFADYSAEKEKPFLAKYRSEKGAAYKHTDVAESAPDDFNKDYGVPRAFLDKPFDLDHEMAGSARLIERFAPPGKQVGLVQWSGDTLPFAAAIDAAERAGLANMNGGDTRYDRKYPSVAWISPVGRPVNGKRQIYAAASNENTYTELWSANFFGFRFLQDTLRNTDSPVRLKPANIYYHMYSGEKLASIRALRSNLDFIRSQEVAPISATQYARLAQGFYSTRLVPLGPRRWRVEDRGDLQTIRFDRAADLVVDMATAKGVLGMRHYQGSLYVALDPAHKAPEFALAGRSPLDGPPAGPRPWLEQARWPVQELRPLGKGGIAFRAKGFGPGEMVWQASPGASFTALVKDAGGAERARLAVTADGDGRLALTLPGDGIGGVSVELQPGERRP